MLHLVRPLSILVSHLFRSRSDLVLEILALCQQLAVLNQRKSQPQFTASVRLFPKYLIFDRAANFNGEVIETIKTLGIEPKRTSFQSPWQNGVAERWVGNCRRDLLDHIIVLNERHLRRLIKEYVRYCHEDRTHLALNKETPGGRSASEPSDQIRKVISMPRVGGLHHRYDLAT